MTPLKFCMVTTFYPPYNFGGDGIFVYRLSNALAEHGHEVHVVYNKDAFYLLSERELGLSYPNHANVVLHPLTTHRLQTVDLLLAHQLGRPLAKHSEIHKILTQNRFDVIHFHNISLMGGPHVLGYGNGVKLCTLHDYWFVCAMHVLWRFNREACQERSCLRCTLAGHRPPQLWRYNGALARAVRHVDAFIGPSRSSCRLHLANGFPAPLRHLPHFLPKGEVASRAEQVDKALHPQPYFLFVGRLEKIKGVQILLELFKTYRKADLLIAGTGTYETELRLMAQDMPHVHFLGMLDHAQLQGFYQQAIATLIPSLCYETFGWTTLESFVMRTPVIVNKIGALPEIVQGGGGLLYQTTDELRQAMERLRTQPELRRTMGEQGYENYTSHYTEEQHLTTYFELLRELRELRELQKFQFHDS